LLVLMACGIVSGLLAMNLLNVSMVNGVGEVDINTLWASALGPGCLNKWFLQSAWAWSKRS